MNAGMCGGRIPCPDKEKREETDKEKEEEEKEEENGTSKAATDIQQTPSEDEGPGGNRRDMYYCTTTNWGLGPASQNTAPHHA